MRCGPAGRRCGRPAPWPTGPARASTRRRSAWPWSCSRWSTPTRPVCCSPPTRPTGVATRRSSGPPGGWASRWSAGWSTPTTWWCDAGDGRVLSRQTADKAVLTVYAEHGTEQRPVPAERRTRPVLDDAAAVELAAHRRPHRGAFRRPAGHRVGPRRWRVLRRAVPADHGPAGPDRPDPDRLDGARPDGVLRAGQHRRAAARPAHAAVRRPDRRLGHTLAAGAVTGGAGPRRGASGGRRAAHHQRLRLLPLRPRRDGPDDAGTPRRHAVAAPTRGARCPGPLAQLLAPALRRGARPVARGRAGRALRPNS